MPPESPVFGGPGRTQGARLKPLAYFDASALAKRYVRESDSAAVGALLGRFIVVTSRLSHAEVSSAVVRRWREGVVTAGDRDRLLGGIGADFGEVEVVEMSREICQRAVRLMVRHLLRTGDAIQLASALTISEQTGHPPRLRFVAFDDRLNAAAVAEGLAVRG